MIQSLQHNLQLSRQNRLLVLLLLLCLAFLNLPSSGFVRYGGEEDEGSGIGGTGRINIPGSDSGLGGTGFKPFIGYSQSSLSTQPDQSSESRDGEVIDALPALGSQDARELVIYTDPAELPFAVSNTLDLDLPDERPVKEQPLPAPFIVADSNDYTSDSSEILISEQIQRDLDADALFYRQLEQDDAAKSDSSDQAFAIAEITAGNEELYEAREKKNEQVTWQALSRYLQNNESTAADSNSSYAALAAEDVEANRRAQRPERLQRPELPPVQRVRPVQRAGILPPRVKPLKL